MIQTDLITITEQTEEKRIFVKRLLSSIAGTHYKALYEFITTDLSTEEIAEEYGLRSHKKLYAWRKEFYEKYYNKFYAGQQ